MYRIAYTKDMLPSDNLAADRRQAAKGEGMARTLEGAASGIPPGIQRSQEAFRRNLPGLLENKKLHRQWVAYHGDALVGFARSETDLYKQCFQRGLRTEMGTS